MKKTAFAMFSIYLLLARAEANCGNLLESLFGPESVVSQIRMVLPRSFNVEMPRFSRRFHISQSAYRSRILFFFLRDKLPYSIKMVGAFYDAKTFQNMERKCATSLCLHFYLVVKSHPDMEEVIVDSLLHDFPEASSRATDSKIFVGTSRDLHNRVQGLNSEAKFFEGKVLSRERVTRYVDVAWSLGEYRQYRSDLLEHGAEKSE